MPPNWNAADYVLSRFSGSDVEVIENAVRQAADAVETWVREGVNTAMNRFNAEGVPGSKTKGSGKREDPAESQ